jgi:hypothetical protein
VVPTLRQAQGRLFRKGRERWGTHFASCGREIKVPALSLQKTERQGRGTRASGAGILTEKVRGPLLSNVLGRYNGQRSFIPGEWSKNL